MDSDVRHVQETILWSVIALCCAKKKLLRRKKRKIWCKQWLSRRPVRTSFNQIFSELGLAAENEADFRNYTRMPLTAFHTLLQKIQPFICKEDTHLRESISPGARLEATLRFLATGDSYTSLQYSTRISKQSLSHIIPETCAAIYHVLKDEYLKIPTTHDEWMKVSKEYEEKWHFPHCVGAVDGKHIIIRPPGGSGSYYYNYMGTHSIVVMAVVNANYEFMYVDVGTNGRVSDTGEWANCTLYSHLERETISLPEDQQLPGSHRKLPFVFIGDNAFPLKRYFMKPYPFRNQDDQQRIFSYRLSRARRTVENAFGIMSSKFGIFKSAINLEPAKVEKIVLACTALHNYLRREHSAEYTPLESMDRENTMDGSITPGTWREGRQLLPLERMRRNPTEEAKEVRREFTAYFNEEGAILWQQHMSGLPQRGAEN